MPLGATFYSPTSSWRLNGVKAQPVPRGWVYQMSHRRLLVVGKDIIGRRRSQNAEVAICM